MYIDLVLIANPHLQWLVSTAAPITGGAINGTGVYAVTHCIKWIK